VHITYRPKHEIIETCPEQLAGTQLWKRQKTKI